MEKPRASTGPSTGVKLDRCLVDGLVELQDRADEEGKRTPESRENGLIINARVAAKRQLANNYLMMACPRVA